jgi:hypothetical protein
MIPRTAIISAVIAIGAAGCTSPLTPGRMKTQEMMNDLARQEQLGKQSATIMAAFEPLVACVTRRAAMLAPEPELADTLARATLSGCSQFHSDWTHTVMHARDLFDYDRARVEIDEYDAKLRDMALGIIVDLRARARQTPRYAPPSALPRNTI